MKRKIELILFVAYVLTTGIDYVCANLDTVLHNFETLNYDAFKHHIRKRDLYTRDPDRREVEYKSFGRHFKLMLQKSASILANDFRVIAVGPNNTEEVVDFKPAIYHGYLEDEPDTSSVSAYWEDERSLLATITTRSDVFTVEPSWRHLPGSSNYSMILYRMSDLDMEADLGTSFCGFIREGPDAHYTNTSSEHTAHQSEDPESESGHSRKRRSSSCTPTKTKPVCKLLLVADYRFYQGMGQSNIGKTTTYLIGLIDRVNAIYGSTSFGSCAGVFGFEIQEIRVLTVPTVVTNAAYGDFNMEKDSWDTSELLEMFSRDAHYKDFCLAHLFTQIPFQNGVLGLAYIGGSRPYSVGGICSPSYYKGGYQLYLNTGWSSAVSRSNRLLLSAEATLVTAHELGHNWGSEHDPDSPECSPSTKEGGKYIMYTYSVSGMDSNNQLFSPCSRRSMGAVLEAKAEGCFKQSVGGFCGNMRVEGDEKCDAGATDTDPCCDRQCHLKPGAVCSNLNDDCCSNCQYAPAQTVCDAGGSGGSSCYDSAYCTGSSKTCPQASPLTDGTKCLLGKCKAGLCKSLCEFSNKFSCACDSLENTCKWCCRDTPNTSSNCSKFGNENLPEGMPCLQGYCDAQGNCNKTILHNAPRPWDIIENLTVNKLVQFMRSNIVGTVIVLSLILWIPICCIISFVDYRNKQEKKAFVQFHDTQNEQFVDPRRRGNIQIIPARGIATRPRRVPTDDQMSLLAAAR